MKCIICFTLGICIWMLAVAGTEFTFFNLIRITPMYILAMFQIMRSLNILEDNNEI